MGHAFQSPMRRWDVIAGLCQSIDARTFVEVGCKEGRTTGFVLAQCPQVNVVAIDPWCVQPKSDDPTRETYEDWDFAEIERQFWEHVGANTDRCRVIRTTSEAAAAAYADSVQRQLAPPADIVFVDALHNYDSVMQDISAWWPLVRDGGFLCGHDFNHKWPGVMRAVADNFPLMRVGLCPDSVWFVQKDSTALRAAA